MDFDPQTRFVDAGGGRLAYQVVDTGGDGYVVWYQDLIQHLDLFWTDGSLVETFGLLAQDGLNSIFLQVRGCGLSDPVDRVPTVDEQAADLLAVMDAEGVGRATVVGNTTTSLPVALAAAQQPERVHGLVLIGPPIVGPLVSDNEFGWTPERAEAFVRGYRRGVDRWGSGQTLLMFQPDLATPYNLRLTGMAERCTLSAATAGAMLERAMQMDGRTVYPEVRAPARVLRIAHPGIPDEAVRAVADAIPAAEYHEMPQPQLGDSIGQTWRPVVRHVAEMARGAHARYGSTDTVLATVLFTDIVNSTDNLARLGDTAWTQILEAHDRLLRRHVAAVGGRYVKNTGDGALCEFASPAAAVTCAVKLCASAAELGIEIRAGVHTGECERRGADLAGLAVHVGARVCAEAGPGEVLVSRTVHDLVAGSKLAFVSRGERELKGVPGPWELFASGLDARSEQRAAHATPRPRAGDRVVMEISRRAPGALRTANRLGNALQKRRYERRRS